MALKFETIEEAIDGSGIKICVYGFAGAGKTVLSTTIGKPTIILNAEGGLLSLKKILKENPDLNDLIRIITVKCMDDVEEALDMFKSEKICDWIVIDSLSEVAEVLLGEYKRSGGDGRAAYGDMADKIMDKMRAIRDLPGYNVLMTAKMDKDKNQDTGRTQFMPMMPGRQLAPQVPHMFDEIFALRVERDDDGNDYRVLQTGLSVDYYCKDRSGVLSMYEPADIDHIAEKIAEVMPDIQDEPAQDEDQESEEPSESEEN